MGRKGILNDTELLLPPEHVVAGVVWFAGMGLLGRYPSRSRRVEPASDVSRAARALV
jgi:hypothetical protein